MITNILRNIAYLFYPKHVIYNHNKDVYVTTQEYKNLIEILDSVSENYQDYSGNVWATIEGSPLFQKFRKADVTNLNMPDRCFNFQLIDIDHTKNKHYSICVNLSFLMPLYTVYALETAIDIEQKWISKPVRNIALEQSSYHTEITELRKIAENTGYYRLSEKIMFQKIHDISFQNIEPDRFNFFNAFFLNDYITKI